MHHKNFTSFNEENLRFENEIRKLKLRAEFGMKLSGYPTTSLQQEKEWLQQLESFERQYADYNQLPVFVYLKEPQDFISPAQINRTEIPQELTRLQQYLREHQILVESICKVPDKELYRFILEEVFYEEVPKERNPEYPRRFVYEDYHPNQEYDIKTALEDFFHKTFNHFWTLLEGQLCNRVQGTSRSSLSREKVIEKLNSWTQDYEELQLTDIKFDKIKIESSKASASVRVYYEGLLPVSYETVHQEMFANFQLVNEDWSIWRISGLYLPFL